MSFYTRTFTVCMIVVGFIVGGCGGGGGVVPSSSPTGEISVRVDFTRSSSTVRTLPVGTNTVIVSVTGNGLPTALNAALTPSNPSTTFSTVPVGTKIVRADAFDGTPSSPGNLLGAGFTDVVVVKDQTANADVTVGTVTTEERQVVGATDIDGDTVTLYQSTDGSSRLLRTDSQGLKLYGERAPGNSREALFSPPVLAPNGLHPGETYSQTSTILIDGFDRGRVGVLVRHEGLEGVRVPGGEFSGNVPHLSVTFTPLASGLSVPRQSPITLLALKREDLWFAANLGPAMIRDEFT
ncbi:MAG: hypothetical protein HY318_12805, partial [Armatimonadetes bacterium]|nr:hypothetical protein [Armatimonadota bacterium]